MGDFQEQYQRNLELVKEFQQNNPFRHEDINQFYLQHQGDDGDLHSEIHYFIPTLSPFYLDFHIAIYRLLLFLDQEYGEVPLSIGKSEHTTTLRQHTLSVTEVMLRSLGNRKNDCSKALFFTGGFAALSCNAGRGLGPRFCEQYSNINDKKSEQTGLGQATLALLEQIPEVNSLNWYEDLKEIIRIYHIQIDYSVNSIRFPLDKDNAPWKLAKLLAAAELQVRRKEIFSIAEKPEGFWSSGGEIMKKKAEEAAEIAQQAESERQVKMEEELQRKKDAYIGEIKGLRNSRDQLNAEIIIKDKIIHALRTNDKENEKLAVEELKRLKKSIRDKGEEKTVENP